MAFLQASFFSPLPLAGLGDERIKSAKLFKVIPLQLVFFPVPSDIFSFSQLPHFSARVKGRCQSPKFSKGAPTAHLLFSFLSPPSRFFSFLFLVSHSFLLIKFLRDFGRAARSSDDEKCQNPLLPPRRFLLNSLWPLSLFFMAFSLYASCSLRQRHSER